MLRLPPISTRTVTSFPYTTLVRSQVALARGAGVGGQRDELVVRLERRLAVIALFAQPRKHRGLLVALALRGADAFETLHLAGVVLHRVFPAARTENLKRAQADCLCARFEFGKIGRAHV